MSNTAQPTPSNSPTLAAMPPQGEFKTISPDSQPSRLLRVSEVLELIPVCRSTWWNWCKSGKAPASFKIGKNTAVWRLSEIEAFIEGKYEPVGEAN